MFTEDSLREDPTIVKTFMGIPAEQFWDLVRQVEERLPLHETRRLMRDDRRRARGAGRKFGHSLVIRLALVLTYARLHTTQAAVAAMYGATQPDVSRELRRLLPILQTVLPCPEVWPTLAEDQPFADTGQTPLTLAQLTDARALIDATEQRVYRAQDNETRKAYYSGKKKAFTLKTQVVTDGAHHIVAISPAVPGATHDKKLCDAVHTLAHLPDGCEADADKGYQGLAAQVEQVPRLDPGTGIAHAQPRLTVQTPIKQSKKHPLTVEEEAFNAQLSAVRVRVEHCIGWIKNWKVMAERFRCAHSIYTSILRTVCGFVNVQTLRWQAAKTASG